MQTYYFTGTGNSLQVARGVGLGGELISIPRFLRLHGQSAERIPLTAEAIGLVFPTYWLAVPPIVIEFLQRVRFDTDYLFAIATLGNCSLTLKSQLLQAVRLGGHNLSYYNQIRMPDNYLPLCDMAKEKKRFSADALARGIDALAADIQARKHNVSGLAALTFLRPFLLRNATKQLAGFSERFFIDSACNGCGTCAQVCSAKSIRVVDSVPHFGSSCNACVACIHNCPRGAIHMKNEKSSERYLNPTVLTDDIIFANS